jgi:capsule polysaccharide modification protein KpsS
VDEQGTVTTQSTAGLVVVCGAGVITTGRWVFQVPSIERAADRCSLMDSIKTT